MQKNVNMNLAIMQPYLFPYLGYFQLIHAVDKFVIYDDVNYINRGWINRNRILVNGQDKYITMPLKEASQNKKINEIEVARDEKSRKKIMKMIQMAYAKAPYFQKVYPIIETILSSDIRSLSEFLYMQLQMLCDYLQIKTTIEPTSTKYKNQHLNGQYRILDICIQEGVQQYINPTGGRDLYDKALFQQNDIELNFLQSNPIQYTQFQNEFVSWLSIIDIMMFNDDEKINQFLDQYNLE